MNMGREKFRLTSKGWPCVICGNTTGHCKSKEGDRGDLLHYCHNHSTKPNSPIDGYHFTSAAGEWGIFSSQKPQYQGESTRSKAPKKEPQPLPNPETRDAAFRCYMAKLTLHSDDRADLHRRGVSDEQIDAWGVVSIEGKEPGYIVPCYSPEGLILGAQWRLREAGDGARYKWISWIGGGSKNGDELPLAVHRPIDTIPVGIAVCEGIGAKSFILAQRSGMVTIGAGSDSQFISSPSHWKEYLATICAETNSNTLTFYPDAGSVKNDSVMGKYRQWFKAIAELGYEVQVAWWGQTVKGESSDPDELTDGVDVKMISVAQFEAMAEPPAPETPWKCLSSHLHQLGLWKNIDVPIESPNLIQAHHDRVATDPNLVYLGPCTIKKEEVERFREFDPKTNFDLKVSKILEDSTGGGIEFEVTWMENGSLNTRHALVKTIDIVVPKNFAIALTASLKTHCTSILKPDQLAAIVQNRKTQYLIGGGVVYRLADRIGQQSDGTWVFDGFQFKPDGTPTTEKESRWMFNHSLCELENIPSPNIAPQNPTAIKDLVKSLQAFYSPEAMPYVLLTLGFAVMGLHRQEIMKNVGEVASLAIYGEKGGGKSAAQRAAASLYGLHDFSLSDVSVSMFGEYAKSLGSLPIQWDDPIRQGAYAKADEEKVNTALWKLFTGLGRAVRGNNQAPNTIVSVSTNRTLGQGNAAIASRLISFIFPVHPVTRSAGAAMSKAMKGASGGLSQILAIPCDVTAIEAHGNQLLEHLSEADSRNANALATLAYFTQKFCDLADVDFDALTFVKTDICPQTNEQGAGKDSLTDFLEKLAILKAENLAGDWNLGETKKRDGSKYLAVHMAGLWDVFEGRFKPNYGQSLVAKLAEDAGGIKNDKRNFVDTKDNAVAYQKAMNAWRMGIAGSQEPGELRRDRQAKVLLIPRAVAEKAGFFPAPESTETEPATTNVVSEPIATDPVEYEVEPAIETQVNPESITPGDVVVMMTDRAEGSMMAGDEVIVISVHQCAETRRWFMAVMKGDDERQVSVWADDLKFKIKT